MGIVGVPAGIRGVRQVGTGNGGRVPGALPAVVLLQLLHLHRAEYPKRCAHP